MYTYLLLTEGEVAAASGGAAELARARGRVVQGGDLVVIC